MKSVYNLPLVKEQITPQNYITKWVIGKYNYNEYIYNIKNTYI